MADREREGPSGPVTLTRYTATDDSKLAKQFSLDERGKLKKTSHAQFSRGVAKRAALDNGLASLPGLVDDLEPDECIGTGVFDVGRCRVIPRGVKDDGEGTLPVRHRTKELMQQPCPGLVMFDHDPSPSIPDGLRCHSPDELIGRLRSAIPELRNVGWIGRGSSSNGITKALSGERFPGNGGLHLYVAATITDLDTLRAYLETRLWLAGLGYVELARNGRRLLRTLIDLSVISAERLIFETRPVVGRGLNREEQPWTRNDGSLFALDSLEVTADEAQEVERLQAAALNAPGVLEAAEARYEGYRNDLVEHTAEVRGISHSDALRIVPSYQDAMVDKQTVYLTAGHPVFMKGNWMAFGDLMARAEEFDGQSLPDPVEGPEYGRSTAKLYANNGSPVIHSLAHGVSTSYLCGADEKTASSPKPTTDPRTIPSSSAPALAGTTKVPKDLATPLDINNFPHIKETRDGPKPKATFENFQHVLDGYSIHARYDVIGKELLLHIPGMKGTVDNRLASGMARIESLAILNGMSTTNCGKYLTLLADEAQVNPIADWIISEPWDGTDRLPLLYATLKTRDDFPLELKVAIVYRWLLSAVAAALKPSGFHCRGVLTLQGPQGIGKTTWLVNLVSDTYLRDKYVLAGHHLDPSIKDTILLAIQHWLVELGELDSSFKKDIARIKGVITNDSDKVRKPYAAAASEYQRRTVFAASVNEEHFLVDPTGNTRWWVLPVTEIDFQHDIDMQQVFAQLKEDFDDGTQWWLTREEEALLKDQNRWYEAVNVIEEKLLEELCSDLPESDWPAYTATEVLRCLDYTKPTNPQARECGSVLRKHFGPPRKIRGVLKWRLPLRSSRY